MGVAHSYRLGKDQSFTFSGGIANKDVRTLTITRETGDEAEVTTRGSGNEQEFVPVHLNTTFEVVVLDHSCVMHGTGVVTVAPATGGTGTTITGVYYVNNVSEPQENGKEIEYTISLRRTVGN
jgi:hypothetical protein